MSRFLAVAVAAAVAGAALLAPVPAARAGGRAPIHTYRDQESFNLTGLGKYAGWYDRLNGPEQVVLSPHLAFSETFAQAYFSSSDKPVHGTWSFLILSGRTYYKGIGASTWKISKLSAAQTRHWQQQLNPYNSAAKFDAIRGVTRVGPGHYQVTATPAQAGAFLEYEYYLFASDLTDTGIKSVTVSLWLDSTGRPARFTVTARSSEENVNISETFTHYNQPMTIKAP